MDIYWIDVSGEIQNFNETQYLLDKETNILHKILYLISQNLYIHVPVMFKLLMIFTYSSFEYLTYKGKIEINSPFKCYTNLNDNLWQYWFREDLFRGYQEINLLMPIYFSVQDVDYMGGKIHRRLRTVSRREISAMTSPSRTSRKFLE